MYKALFGLAVAAGFAISLFFIVGPATADPYKWCAVYGNGFGGSNCGFVTIEQCGNWRVLRAKPILHRT
jgi:hypothetical protein